MIEKINGFQILRKVKCLGDIAPYFNENIIGKRYEGIDRPSFEDLYEDFYAKKLPKVIYEIIQNSGNESNYYPYMNIIKKFNDAKKIMEYNLRINDFNDLIALQLDKLSEVKGEFEFHDAKIKWLGYDVISQYGFASLISMGLFFKPNHFTKWIDIINIHGLFDDKKYLDEYVYDYSIAATKGVVENHVNFKDKLGVDLLRIGKIDFS